MFSDLLFQRIRLDEGEISTFIEDFHLPESYASKDKIRLSYEYHQVLWGLYNLTQQIPFYTVEKGQPTPVKMECPSLLFDLKQTECWDDLYAIVSRWGILHPNYERRLYPLLKAQPVENTFSSFKGAYTILEVNTLNFFYFLDEIWEIQGDNPEKYLIQPWSVLMFLRSKTCWGQYSIFEGKIKDLFRKVQQQENKILEQLQC